MSESGKSREKKASLSLAVLFIALITVTVSLATLHFKVDVHVPIAMLTVVVGLVAYFYLRIDYADLEKAALESIMIAMPSCMILMLVGILIGLWMRSGVIPGLIYYGLGILKPSIFPLATFLICCVISLSSGSSLSTMATVGVAMMGIGNGLGISSAMTAGIVVSGAYFGDKMSPLSDTTNLAPAVSGGNLFDHIRAMLWTTGPTTLLIVFVFLYWGKNLSNHELDITRIEAIRTLIASEFSISAFCIVPPVLVILASIFKIPAMPGICIGIFSAMIMAFAQGVSIGEIWDLGQWGYKARLSGQIVSMTDLSSVADVLRSAGVENLAPEIAKDVSAMISRLVNRGGIQSMMWSISLAVVAMTMGGFLERAGILRALLDTITKGIRRVGGLVATTIAACFTANLLTGSQYLSIIIPGRMFKTKYDESGLAPRMLSRTLEDSATLTSVLVPWNICGGYATTLLGVPTLVYAPYALLNWINPLFAIVLTYLGLGIFWRRPGKEEDYLERRTELPVAGEPKEGAV